MIVKNLPNAKELLDLPVGAEVALQVTGAAADHIAQVSNCWATCPTCSTSTHTGV